MNADTIDFVQYALLNLHSHKLNEIAYYVRDDVNLETGTFYHCPDTALFVDILTRAFAFILLTKFFGILQCPTSTIPQSMSSRRTYMPPYSVRIDAYTRVRVVHKYSAVLFPTKVEWTFVTRVIGRAPVLLVMYNWSSWNPVFTLWHVHVVEKHDAVLYGCYKNSGTVVTRKSEVQVEL